MSKLTINFESEQDLEDFKAWFMAGGGEDSLAEYCEARGEDFFLSELIDDEINMSR